MLLSRQPDRIHSPDTAPEPSVERRQWVRLLLPGISDRKVRFDTPEDGLLADAIREILDEMTFLSTVDILTYPGHHQQEYLLNAIPSTDIGDEMVSGRIANTTLLTTLQEAGVDQSTAALAAHLSTALIDRIGLEVVEIDLTPIGTAPTQTTRVVTTTADPLAVEPPRSQFAAHLASLHRHKTPYLARTIIGAPSHGKTYRLEQQVARFGPEYRCLHSGDVVKQFTQSPPAADSIYSVPEITTARHRLAESDWMPRTCGSGLRKTHSTTFVATDDDPERAVQWLVQTGLHRHEFDYLCGRTAQWQDLSTAYDRLGVSPTLVIEPPALPGFLGLVPNYDFDKWFKYTPFIRAAPELTSIAPVRDASGTDFDNILTRETPAPPTPNEEHLADLNVWRTPPFELLRTAARELREHGDALYAGYERVPPEATFLRETPDGDVEPVCVGTQSTLMAGDLIALLERIPSTCGVTIVTATETDVQWLYDVLSRPFIDATEQWVCPYPRTTRYWILEDEEAAALHPADTLLEWRLHHDGTLIGMIDDNIVTTGDRTAPPSTAAPHVLRGRKEPRQYSVFHPEHGFLIAGRTITDLADRFHPIPLPAIPSRLSYLDQVTIFVVSNGRLYRYPPNPVSADESAKWYETAFNQFVSMATCPAEDTIPAREVQSRFQRYVSTRVPRPSPSDVRFDMLLRKSRIDSNDIGSRPSLAGRTWRYPLGDPSPITTDFDSSEPAQDAYRLSTHLNQQ